MVRKTIDQSIDATTVTKVDKYTVPWYCFMLNQTLDSFPTASVYKTWNDNDVYEIRTTTEFAMNGCKCIISLCSDLAAPMTVKFFEYEEENESWAEIARLMYDLEGVKVIGLLIPSELEMDYIIEGTHIREVLMYFLECIEITPAFTH